MIVTTDKQVLLLLYNSINLNKKKRRELRKVPKDTHIEYTKTKIHQDQKDDEEIDEGDFYGQETP